MGCSGREALVYVNPLASHTSLTERKTFVECKLEKTSIFSPVLDRRPPPRASAQHQQKLLTWYVPFFLCVCVYKTQILWKLLSIADILGGLVHLRGEYGAAGFSLWGYYYPFLF